MPKTVESPVGRWPGKVTLADPMTLPQVMAYEAALDEIAEDREGSEFLKRLGDGDTEVTWSSQNDKAFVAAICACVEKWELKNFPKDVTPDTWPATPRGDSHALVEWLAQEINRIYLGEIEVPNA